MSGLDWDDDGSVTPEGGAEPGQPATAPAPANAGAGEKMADKVANKMLSDLGVGKKEEPPARSYGSGGYGGGYNHDYGYGYDYGYRQRSFDDFDNDLDLPATRPSNVRQGPGMRYSGGKGNFKGSAWGKGSSSGGYRAKTFEDVIDYIDEKGLNTADMFYDGFMQEFLEDNFLLGKFFGALQVWYAKRKPRRGLASDPDLEVPDE